MDTPRDEKDLYKKWGAKVLSGGWTSTPNLLLKNSGKLGLDPTETLALINLIRYWWKQEELPYPSISKTSEEMGVTRKTLSKKFASLKEKGLIQEVKAPGQPIKYSLQGLVDTLERLSDEEASARRR